ncbi:hypothetical protein NpPPO83_00007621 [Neofusicoccum parvum]|uniref:Uncharacterized protein n=1 Tax=Neofusicoccum parvum TaxID=310453 RepID=A0ACB5SDY2_9PEZI|nr:hypothetical protein NpPPO83_00007621 [Neofusicoccum parvum]
MSAPGSSARGARRTKEPKGKEKEKEQDAPKYTPHNHLGGGEIQDFTINPFQHEKISLFSILKNEEEMEVLFQDIGKVKYLIGDLLQYIQQEQGKKIEAAVEFNELLRNFKNLEEGSA